MRRWSAAALTILLLCTGCGQACPAPAPPGLSSQPSSSPSDPVQQEAASAEGLPSTDIVPELPPLGPPAAAPEEVVLPPLLEQTPADAIPQEPSAEEPSPLEPEPQEAAAQTLTLSVNGTPLAVAWEDNPSVQALAELAAVETITVSASSYGGFEQVGSLPQELVRNDAQMTTAPGDIVLYSGNSIVLFYGSNRWSYTKLGHIEGLSEQELAALLDTEQVEAVIALGP